jgi:peptidoglycan/xylan/chitin deacetylase (PgdA/CDA1 family)
VSRLVRSVLVRALGAALSPGGANGRLSILIFHRVLAAPDALFPEEIDARRFAEQMELLASAFNVLPLAEAVERLAQGALPPRAACVTFDDGYADNHDVALSILRRFGVPATFFIASGYLEGCCMWNDTVIHAVRQAPGPVLDLAHLGLGAHRVGSIEERRATVHALLGAIKYQPSDRRAGLSEGVAAAAQARSASDLMMTHAQVRSLHSAGMEIGGHTVTHPILSRLSPSEAEREMADGKAQLEGIIGAPVRLFAYPNGKPTEDFGPKHVALAKKLGFRAAVTTAWGAARRSSDPFQLPRFTPWDREPARFAVRLLLYARQPGVEL